MNATKLMEYVIVIALFVILVVVFFSGSGGFAKVKSAASDTIGFFTKLLPTVSVGIDETKSTGIILPIEESEQISALQRAVDAMKQSSDLDCARNVALFSDLEKSTLSIKYDAGVDVTRFVVTGGAGGVQELSRFSVPGIKPCVIAGSATDLFVKRHFTEKMGMIAYVPVNTISISNEEITYDRIDGGSLSGREWLYKPDADHICFFPLNEGVSQQYFDRGSLEELTCS